MIKPHFIIKNNSQKGGYKYSTILNKRILEDVCEKITGHKDYTVDFVNEGYNKGRLAILVYRGTTIFISFSETGLIKGRNYFFQSLTTALVSYYLCSERKKKICFYFLPLFGNIQTNYFTLLFRLMATAGVEFLNASEYINKEIIPYNSVDDIITAREMNKSRNKSNNSTYLTRNSSGATEIYGKTYGASKKETALLCIAVSRLASQIDLYEICEQDLTELPRPDLDVILSLGNVTVIPTDLTLERREFEINNSLRSPQFIYNLLEKLGPKKCSLCNCEIPELIEGAHVWPVADIKKRNRMTIQEKLTCATDGDNGLWLCENHHRLFDLNLFRINKNGKLEYYVKIDKKALEFIDDITLESQISNDIITPNFLRYLQKRNNSIVNL